ncbi:molybdenum cofactor guanylyltransferase [Geobacillus thermodenitrificans]|jgi:molybdenum cofactor guanylyltransferase|uniref:Probable molybdenum cofactor guanylyltransferase n=2 Tax=Geobacillus thermodenitrificans TaxID=33940 RepID=A4IL21_GEOTN|nr:Molybdopterin-guanine dinucleotide biosynthesis protein A [Geobacillus thermodenitrificans NG80-2]ARA97539.1 molybdenum cofactor guanylyltransferase [Geobacillus thermodenitrificans]KQB94357.1 putative molybdenum cofactor guanylyltransferase [Geobacillus sp. PA-3]ARP41758.1 putative molybdenum cofactor guanylyltransferase [Geobacillus thermodenitrificans]MED0664060.1 molybdenum cofactor guanylyltransferase [Geobacillus thermodenitrificans]
MFGRGIAMKRTIAGAVLAGGQSRRFGRPKAFALHQGAPFFTLSVAALAPIVDELYIISHPSLVDEFRRQTDIPVLLDMERYRGCGPLAGIYTAMEWSQSDWVFVLPCDMPYMRKEVTERLAAYADSAFDAIVPLHGDRTEPLVALYHQRLGSVIAELLDAGERRMTALLDRVRVRYVDTNELAQEQKVWRNVNTQQEYES